MKPFDSVMNDIWKGLMKHFKKFKKTNAANPSETIQGFISAFSSANFRKIKTQHMFCFVDLIWMNSHVLKHKLTALLHGFQLKMWFALICYLSGEQQAWCNRLIYFWSRNISVFPWSTSLCCVCVCVCNQEYLTELQALLRSVSETDFKLNSPEYWPAAYYNLPQQELCLKVSTASEFLDGRNKTFLKKLSINHQFVTLACFTYYCW